MEAERSHGRSELRGLDDRDDHLLFLLHGDALLYRTDDSRSGGDLSVGGND